MGDSEIVNKEKEGVVLDTNILLYIYEGFDPLLSIVERFDYKPDFYIHKAVINELMTIRGREKGFAKAARVNVALQYLDKFSNSWKLIDMECRKRVDECLLDTAKEMKLILMTNDSRLKEKALRSGIKVLYIQGKGKIIKSLVPL
ncbi:type II toxin-antitoxin system VapC family toxin [Sulfuracidifex metallicus]|jgi:rRNA-processing protein FCF1|uniref:PIN domain-containing protein n=1 Tax=Sulfuracidifex metallicus DSM 6482 = JCM 9184 TaxID=523847 RepID=A0A6A9QKQ4_SULME|nr:PIN domain-containing protein [Sulfuracidifex metallicus]MUN28298.1 PIN domain-containing protein [Sulfuracidifex metallicus DSM 6482 = JCM 9184]WOE51171.1 PIN domain-containing protein [Sulfuracidifex metallicus DSM 6482 = JCM 9184]